MTARTRLLVVLALASALALAGCLQSPSSGPNAPPGNESFEVVVSGNSSHSVNVAVHLYTERPEGVTLRYANDSTRDVAVPTDQGLLAGAAPDGLRSLDTPEADGGVYFEGPPEFSASALEIAKMPTAIYVVRVDGSQDVAAWGIATCDGHVDQITFTTTGANVTLGGLACSN